MVFIRAWNEVSPWKITCIIVLVANLGYSVVRSLFALSYASSLIDIHKSWRQKYNVDIMIFSIDKITTYEEDSLLKFTG